jgi:parallel beta-helix repeat protein
MRRRRTWIMALLVLLMAASPSIAGTYYVRKTGNDTSGDGSDALPWLTISKALATVAIGGNHTINVGDGTYQEDTGGVGYLHLTRVFVAEVVVQSESGVASGVIIQGASSASFDIRCNGASNLTFRNVTLQPRLGTNTSAFKLIGGNSTNLKFDGVRFINATGEALSIAVADATALNGLTLLNCAFSQTGANVVYGLRLQTLLTGTATNITISGSTFTMSGASTAFYLNRQLSNITITDTTASNTGAGTVARIDGVTTATVTNLTATSTGGAGGVPFIVGADAATGLASSDITISGSTFTAAASHGFLVGALVDGATISNIVVNGGDHGIVLKSCANVTVSNAIVRHNGGVGLYMKGATSSMIQDSTAVSFGGACIGIDLSTATQTASGTYQRNRCSTRGAANVFAWTAAADGGGNVVDSNTYSLCGSGEFGVVLADADVQTFAELLAAWDGYGAGTNDENSRLMRSSFASIGPGGMWSRSIADCPDGTLGAGPGLR